MDRQVEIHARILFALLMGLMFIVLSPIKIKAESLDSVISEEQETLQDSNLHNSDYVEYIKDATNLSEPSMAANKINGFTSKIASFIVSVVGYFVTAFLVVRVVLDLCYIVIPFTRSLLSNGYQGNAQSNMNPMGQPNGMAGAGGMNGMNGMARAGQYNIGNNMQMQGQAQITPASGRMQLVSNEALNAVAAETVMNPNGKPNSAITVYAKSATKLLVATAILLTLSISGALTNLGFLLGELLSNGINSIGNML